MTKEEYQKFVLRYKGCGACFPNYYTLSQEEKLWFSAIQKDVTGLKDKIADIKANCDLAIEGRDIKIKELEDHLAEEVELHLHAEEYIKSLEQQIEKMKCCGNCKYSNQESAYTIVCKVGGVDKTDYIATDDNQVCDKWELMEIEK